MHRHKSSRSSNMRKAKQILVYLILVMVILFVIREDRETTEFLQNVSKVIISKETWKANSGSFSRDQAALKKNSQRSAPSVITYLRKQHPMQILNSTGSLSQLRETTRWQDVVFYLNRVYPSQTFNKISKETFKPVDIYPKGLNTRPKEIILAPNGKFLEKFNPQRKVVSYAYFTDKCTVTKEDFLLKLNCPDIRTKGETVLRQSQLVITRMLQIFDIICRKIGVKYWLSRGTLLGAVRHRGFIPWDNDADISMLREDYFAFLSKGARYLPSDIFLQNYDSDKEFLDSPCEAKLRDKQSCYGYCFLFDCHNHDGLQVDIFVFDRFQDIIYNRLTEEIYTFRHIFPLQDQVFEGFFVMVPGKYNKILKTDYGDNYIKFPSVEEQYPEDNLTGIPWFSCEYLQKKGDMIFQKYVDDTTISLF